MDRSPHRQTSGGGRAVASARLLPAGVTWERVTELFSAALDRPAAERASFLTTSCGDNVALLTEVSSLLQSLGLAGDFLEPGTTIGPPLSPSLLGELNETPLFTQFKPGAVIGQRYRVQALLGRGGAGEVYEAWDEELAIPVALKTLHFGAALGGDALRSLKQEAMLARAVVHPNVCRVYDLACHGDPQNGTWFLTMEVLRGETLAERLRARGRLTPEEAWPLVEQMAAGLEAAHQAAIVHLDFKSGNVMLAGDAGKEQAVITDFGLARMAQPMSEGPAAESDRAIVGTPAYMSPEQVRGEAAGPAADIYALGVVLYEMVTGTLPFTGETALEVAERRLKAAAPSPREITPELDERWEAVIRRCLEREPRRRFARAGDIPEALAGRLSASAGAPERALSIPHSLLIERDRFIGRNVESAILERAMGSGARLVTLVGAGGMGKTRLAMRYGWQSLESWPGGVWFCDLTEARSADGIASAVGRALGIPLGKGDPIAQLGYALAGRGRCLLILDNLEQVLPEAAAIVERWLVQAPDLQFLATSRERLNLRSESVLDVAPLELESGLELFIDRAKRLRPGLQLDPTELAAAREVVRLVEGIPLAIELAGARMRVMTATQIMAAMRKRFRLLTGGASERHETLAAAIDGSWDLLQPHERAALVQCSVFEGGFTLAAAEAVIDLSPYSDAPWPVDVVQSLLDKSLLRTWVPERATGTSTSAPRFGMYVSLQEYARERLADDRAIPGGGSGPVAARSAEERHGRWFGGAGDEAAIVALEQRGGAERRWALGLDLENLAVASRRAAARGDAETAAATYNAAYAVISFWGPLATAIELGNELLAESLAPAAKARILMALGNAEKDSGRLHEALAHCEAALAIHRELGDRKHVGNALANLGTVHRLQGRMEEARSLYEAALAMHREVGDRPAEGILLGNLGGLSQEQSRLEEAFTLYQASLVIHREVGNRRWEGGILGNMANLFFQGPEEWEKARGYYQAALAIVREVGDRRTEGITLGNSGNLEFHAGQMGSARSTFEAALAIQREVGNRRSEGICLIRLGNVCSAQGQMGEARAHFEAALAIHHEAGDPHWEGVALGNLGSLHFQQGRMDLAQEALTRGEMLLRAAKTRIDLPKLLCVRAEVEHGMGNHATALEILREVQARAAQVGAKPDSELGRMLAKLQQTLATAD